MDLLKLFSDLNAMIGALQSQLADADKAAQDLAKLKYDEGFAAGVASVPVSDKLYSQAELDAAVESAVSPFRGQVSELQSQVAALNAELSALKGSIDAQIAAAVAAMKADLLVKIQAVKDKLDMSEAELLALFAPPVVVEPAPAPEPLPVEGPVVEEPAPSEPAPSEGV